jgi:xanthine dehydrogenase small subunit
MRDHVRFFLNGKERIVRGHDAFATLTEYLRWNLGLCGTKVVCAEGDCGACTVLFGRLSGDQLRYVPVDACIQFVFQLDGAHVVTVEGLPGNGDLHSVQQAMVDDHGSQCGYCTPGIVMALAGWAEAGSKAETARIALTGNLCRCTGYVPILGAATSLAASPPEPMGRQFNCPDLAKTLRSLSDESLQVVAGRRTFLAPTTITDAIAFKAAHSDAVVVAGATELGVMRNKRGHEPRWLLNLGRIAGLDAIDETEDSLTFGANVTWSQIERVIESRLPQFHRIVQRFGSPQIRHAATLVGNIANGSPIADALPLLCVMDAQLEIAGPGGIRCRSINGFYTGYKQKDLRSDELIARVTLPLPSENDRLRLYKVSRRTDLDISTFCAAIRLTMANETISSAAVAYGGVAATVVHLPKTEQFLAGRPFAESTFCQAGRIARGEVAPIADVRGSADFRLQLCENVLRKYYFDEIGACAEAVA